MYTERECLSASLLSWSRCPPSERHSSKSMTQMYLVCRQLYQEMILLLYSVPHFCFYMQPALGEFLRTCKDGHKNYITEIETHWDWCRFQRVKEHLPNLSRVHETVMLPSDGIEYMLNQGITISYFCSIFRPGDSEKRELMKRRIRCG